MLLPQSHTVPSAQRAIETPLPVSILSSATRVSRSLSRGCACNYITSRGRHQCWFPGRPFSGNRWIVSN